MFGVFMCMCVYISISICVLYAGLCYVQSCVEYVYTSMCVCVLCASEGRYWCVCISTYVCMVGYDW